MPTEKFIREMQSRGWTFDREMYRLSFGNCETFISPCKEYCVSLQDGEFSLRRLDDEAQSTRWISLTSGEDIVDLREDLDRLTFARK